MDAFIAGCFIGVTVGLLIAKMLFRIQVEQKARDGFRLECGGRLYRVTHDD